MASPRKGDTIGLIAALSTDEHVGAVDVEPVKRCHAVSANAGDAEFTWDTEKIFGTMRISTSVTLQISFDVWYPGGEYAVRWFQTTFPARNLPQSEVVDRLNRRRHSVISRDYELSERTDGLVEYQMDVLHRRATIALSYRAVRYYDAVDGECFQLRVYSIKMRLARPELFQRFLAYQGHRVTMAVNSKYLYRANLITDHLQEWAERANAEHLIVESARARTGQSDSHASDDSGSDEYYYSAPVDSTRVYTWCERAGSEAPFPSVRDGRPEALVQEESQDLAHVDHVLQRPLDSAESTESRLTLGAGSYNRGLRSLRQTRKFVPDTPYYANNHYRLPVQFNKADAKLTVTFFNFRFNPVRFFSVTLDWDELDQRVFQTHPLGASGATAEPPSRRASLFNLLATGNGRSSLPLLRRKRRSVPVTHVIPPLDMGDGQPASPRQNRGSVEQSTDDGIDVTIRYRSRFPDTTSVDITSVELKATDFETSLASFAVWANVPGSKV